VLAAAAGEWLVARAAPPAGQSSAVESGMLGWNRDSGHSGIADLRVPPATVVCSSTCGVTIAVSIRDPIALVRRGEFAWDALLTWAGLSAVLSAGVCRPWGQARYGTSTSIGFVR